MAKEYLKKLEYLGDYIIGDCKLKSHKYYKELHNYLEAIDNSNPSEALECLEAISKEEIVVRNRNSIYMNPDDNNKGAFTHLTTVGQNFRGAIDTIKQALLKAQTNARSEEILQKYYQEGITLDSVRALKQEKDSYKKILEIIKEKRIDIESFYSSFIERDFNYDFYSSFYGSYGRGKLTKEEFNSLKEVLK